MAGRNGKGRGSGKGVTGSKRSRASAAPVRYAVVGLGYIAQGAVLPAFANAKKNSRLEALVSDDAAKLGALGGRYGVENLCSYEDYEDLLQSGDIDAVFIALPNSMHEEYVVRAARAGVHVLCEKPLGVTERECLSMIRACEEEGVKLMTAYRLHLEAANLEALRIASSGEIGELRAFSSVFTMQVKDDDNIRLRRRLGGGPLLDIGIYCINAARTLFGEEPREVVAMAANSGDRRFDEVDETVSAVMRFSRGRLANFVCSFGASDVSHYRLVGTKGDVCLEPAYEYAERLEMTVTKDEKSRTRQYAERDQFAAELLYFSECVRTGRTPEPSGYEGLADIRVIEAIEWAIDEGRPARVRPTPEVRHPIPAMRIDRPGVRKRELVKANAPSDD